MNTKEITAIFFLLNSVGTLPLFLSLTANEKMKDKVYHACVANVTALILLGCFVILGEPLMSFLGLSLSAFEIGGGIILFKIGMEMVNCTTTLRSISKEAEHINKVDSPGVVPLGIPLLAGPGSIAIIVSLSVTRQASFGSIGLLLSLLVAVVLSAFVWIFGGHFFTRLKGDTVRSLISRLGGLYLLVLAVQMVINGYTKIV